jgi:hypothetical protein
MLYSGNCLGRKYLPSIIVVSRRLPVDRDTCVSRWKAPTAGAETARVLARILGVGKEVRPPPPGWLCTRLDAEMICELGSGEAGRKALRVERQHSRVPLVPLRDQPVIDIAMPLLEVGALHRVLDHIE